MWHTQTLMKHRFLLHALNHTILCVDATSIGIPYGNIADSGEAAILPSTRFRTWANAEDYLLGLGAKQESLRSADDALTKTGVYVLTIT